MIFNGWKCLLSSVTTANMPLKLVPFLNPLPNDCPDCIPSASMSFSSGPPVTSANFFFFFFPPPPLAPAPPALAPPPACNAAKMA